MKNAVIRKTVKTNTARVYSMIDPMNPRVLDTLDFGERVTLAYAQRRAREIYGKEIFVELLEVCNVYEMPLSEFIANAQIVEE